MRNLIHNWYNRMVMHHNYTDFNVMIIEKRKSLVVALLFTLTTRDVVLHDILLQEYLITLFGDSFYGNN